MRDQDCVRFLQWCLPRMGLRWTGYRRVRRTVCKRLRRRLGRLGLGDLDAYREHLAHAPEEWARLDAICRIPISRVMRDRGVFEHLERRLLPDLAAAALARGDSAFHAWSAGCASGEEPYSLSLLWRLRLADAFPGLELRLLATDAEATMLARARRACYGAGSLKELPPGWRDLGFVRRGEDYCLRDAFRAGVTLRCQDIRRRMPAGPFSLILCRNLAFTYFAEDAQRRVLARLARRLVAGGALVIGGHETLPAADLEPAARGVPIYRKPATGPRDD